MRCFPGTNRHLLLAAVCLTACLTACRPAPSGPAAPGGGHPLYPLSAGAVWEYRASGVGGGETRRITRLERLEELVAARIDTDAGYSVAPLLVIADGGGLRLLPARGDELPDAKVLAKAPVFLPPLERIEPGATWHYRGVLPFALQQEADENPALAGPAPQVEAELTVAGRESVAVPAGRFEAWRIDARTRYDLGTAAEGEEVFWYAPEVGLVKHQTGLGGQSIVWELVRHDPGA